MIAIDLENIVDDEQQRLQKLRDEDPIGFGAFGDRAEWIDKRLGDG